MIHLQSPPLRKKLFHTAFAAKQAALKKGNRIIYVLRNDLTIYVGESTPIWDKLVFSKTKARLGGRVRFILSGSAPLDPKLGEFLKM